MDITKVGRATLVSSMLECLLDRLSIVLEDKRWMVAELPEVLQRLEHVLLAFATPRRT